MPIGSSLRHIAIMAVIAGMIAGTDARSGLPVVDAARPAGHGGTPTQHRNSV